MAAILDIDRKLTSIHFKTMSLKGTVDSSVLTSPLAFVGLSKLSSALHVDPERSY